MYFNFCFSSTQPGQLENHRNFDQGNALKRKRSDGSRGESTYKNDCYRPLKMQRTEDRVLKNTGQLAAKPIIKSVTTIPLDQRILWTNRARMLRNRRTLRDDLAEFERVMEKVAAAYKFKESLTKPSDFNIVFNNTVFEPVPPFQIPSLPYTSPLMPFPHDIKINSLSHTTFPPSPSCFIDNIPANQHVLHTHTLRSHPTIQHELAEFEQVMQKVRAANRYKESLTKSTSH